jgi:hypothetical protein
VNEVCETTTFIVHFLLAKKKVFFSSGSHVAFMVEGVRIRKSKRISRLSLVISTKRSCQRTTSFWSISLILSHELARNPYEMVALFLTRNSLYRKRHFPKTVNNSKLYRVQKNNDGSWPKTYRILGMQR